MTMSKKYALYARYLQHRSPISISFYHKTCKNIWRSIYLFFPDWRIIDSHRRILPFEQFEALADPASHGFQSFLLSLVLCLSCKQRHPNAIISFPIIYNILTFTASCTLCSTNSKSVFASNTIFFENKCNIINLKKSQCYLRFHCGQFYFF